MFVWAIMQQEIETNNLILDRTLCKREKINYISVSIFLFQAVPADIVKIYLQL